MTENPNIQLESTGGSLEKTCLGYEQPGGGSSSNADEPYSSTQVTPHRSSPALMEYFLLKNHYEVSADTSTKDKAAWLSATHRLQELLQSFDNPPSDNPASEADDQPPEIDKPLLRRLIDMLAEENLPLLRVMITGHLTEALSGDNVIEKINKLNCLIKNGISVFLARGGTPAPSDSGSAELPSSAEVSKWADEVSKSLGEGSSPGSNNPRKRRVPESPVARRSKRQRSLCIARDQVCVVLNLSLLTQVAHIIPFSLGERQIKLPVGQRSSASAASSGILPGILSGHFWAFLQMFIGAKKTQKLQTRFAKIDLLENLICLQPTVHAYFGSGRLSLTPMLSPEQECNYDPLITSEVGFPTSSEIKLTSVIFSMMCQ